MPIPAVFKSKVLDNTEIFKEAILADLVFANFEGVAEKDRNIVDCIMRDNAQYLIPLAAHL